VLPGDLAGRQARRTWSSSALGQFFDHCCDAFTGAFDRVKSAATPILPTASTTFCFVPFVGVAFSPMSQEEHVTGAFHFGPVKGPDEGLLALVKAHVVTGITPALRILFVN
jgi:hypothetical protein